MLRQRRRLGCLCLRVGRCRLSIRRRRRGARPAWRNPSRDRRRGGSDLASITNPRESRDEHHGQNRKPPSQSARSARRPPRRRYRISRSDESKTRRAEFDLVAPLERDRFAYSAAVDQRAVGRAEVRQLEAAKLARNRGVTARYRRVVEHYIVRRMAANGYCLLI